MRRVFASSFALGVLSVCLASACRPASHAVAPLAKASASSVPKRSDRVDPPHALAACSPAPASAPPPSHVAARSAALALLLDGKPRDAERAFDKVLADKPTDVASYALRVAATSMLDERRGVRAMEHMKPTPVEVALTNYAFTSAPADLPNTPASLAIKVTSTKPGSLGVAPQWFELHGVTAPDAVDEPIPDGGDFRGQFFSRGFHFEDHDIAIFGDSLVTIDGGAHREPKVVDFARTLDLSTSTAVGVRPSILFAQTVGRSLIAEIGIGSDEPSAANGNALVAVDLDSGAVSWVSEPNIATASSFVVSGHFAIVGTGSLVAGSNRGRGNIRVVDLTNGKVVSNVPIDARPLYVVEKDGAILVEGSDGGDVVLEPSEPLAKAPPAALPPAGGAEPPKADVIARTRCFIERAALLLDARDAKGAIAEMDALDDREGRPASAIRAAATFLMDAATRPDDVVDLTAKAPIVVDDVVPHPDARPLGPAPRFTKKESQSTKPPLAKLPGQVPQAALSPPQMALVEGVTFLVPDNYAGNTLGRSFAYPDGNILVYGWNHVAVLRNHKMENVFDIEKLLPDGATLGHAALRGESLMLSIVGGGVSAIYAIDASSGKLLWRSDLGTCAVRFAVLGDYVATASATAASGKAKAQSFLYVLRGDTGATVSKTTLPAAPSDMGSSGGARLVVATESDYVTFAIDY